MKKGRRTCHKCLWNWDLYDDGNWTCYNVQSPNYHCKACGGCRKYEEQPPAAKQDRWYKED